MSRFGIQVVQSYQIAYNNELCCLCAQFLSFLSAMCEFDNLRCLFFSLTLSLSCIKPI